MTATAPTLEDLTMTIQQTIEVAAPLEATFEALLEQMGPANQTPDGKTLAMVLEPFPGGRWFRDLGEDNGHFWGHVQAIKRPTLLEISGPLFLSTAVISNVQYRLSAIDGGTLITFRHMSLGFMPDGYREGIGSGWMPLLERVKRQAEQPTKRSK